MNPCGRIPQTESESRNNEGGGGQGCRAGGEVKIRVCAGLRFAAQRLRLLMLSVGGSGGSNSRGQ